MTWDYKKITDTLNPINDSRMKELRADWYKKPQTSVGFKDFSATALEWFKSTRVNDIQGWQSFPCVDVTMGCTHYIESLIQKYGWQGFQILKNEYAYYTLMGKHGVELDQLLPDIPLLITMPHWQFFDIRPEWTKILEICEQRNIDIYIDMAWIITARNISLDLSHPCIKSIGMSLSKYSLQWSRIGLRLSRQKTMDSITIFNDYYKDTNTVISSIGSYWIENLERDYLWNMYGSKHLDLCDQLNIESTKLIHVAKDPGTGRPLGIGRMLGESAPDSV